MSGLNVEKLFRPCKGSSCVKSTPANVKKGDTKEIGNRNFKETPWISIRKLISRLACAKQGNFCLISNGCTRPT
jgi:hypothetical protein